MRQIKAFTAKELTELVRTGKLLLLMILFVLFGIMNPAIAKLTPWLLEMTAKSMADTGLTITAIQVDATASWTQFYKNVPLAMILFLLLCAGTLTNEYQKGTLINVVTKGLERWKIFVSKWAVLAAVWTAGYWLLYGITYGYTAWFWDNSGVSHPGFSAMCLWLMGLWLVSLVMLASAVFSSGSAVLASVGVCFLALYLLSLLPALTKYLPTHLLIASAVTLGGADMAEYGAAIAAAAGLVVVNLGMGIVLFNKMGL